MMLSIGCLTAARWMMVALERGLPQVTLEIGQVLRTLECLQYYECLQKE